MAGASSGLALSLKRHIHEVKETKLLEEHCLSILALGAVLVPLCGTGNCGQIKCLLQSVLLLDHFSADSFSPCF